MQGDYLKYDIPLEPKDYDYTQSTYNGTLYVIMNKWTASSGESAVSYAKSCKNVVFVGSGTAGIGEFGDIKGYKLLNSKFLFNFGYKVFYMEGFEERKEFIPDYWIDSKNPTKYLNRYLKYKKLI